MYSYCMSIIKMEYFKVSPPKAFLHVPATPVLCYPCKAIQGNADPTHTYLGDFHT